MTMLLHNYYNARSQRRSAAVAPLLLTEVSVPVSTIPPQLFAHPTPVEENRPTLSLQSTSVIAPQPITISSVAVNGAEESIPTQLFVAPTVVEENRPSLSLQSTCTSMIASQPVTISNVAVNGEQGSVLTYHLGEGFYSLPSSFYHYFLTKSCIHFTSDFMDKMDINCALSTYHCPMSQISSCALIEDFESADLQAVQVPKIGTECVLMLDYRAVGLRFILKESLRITTFIKQVCLLFCNPALVFDDFSTTSVLQNASTSLAINQPLKSEMIVKKSLSEIAEKYCFDNSGMKNFLTLFVDYIVERGVPAYISADIFSPTGSFHSYFHLIQKHLQSTKNSMQMMVINAAFRYLFPTSTNVVSAHQSRLLDSPPDIRPYEEPSPCGCMHIIAIDKELWPLHSGPKTSMVQEAWLLNSSPKITD